MRVTPHSNVGRAARVLLSTVEENLVLGDYYSVR